MADAATELQSVQIVPLAFGVVFPVGGSSLAAAGEVQCAATASGGLLLLKLLAGSDVLAGSDEPASSFSSSSPHEAVAAHCTAPAAARIEPPTENTAPNESALSVHPSGVFAAMPVSEADSGVTATALLDSFLQRSHFAQSHGAFVLMPYETPLALALCAEPQRLRADAVRDAAVPAGGRRPGVCGRLRGHGGQEAAARPRGGVGAGLRAGVLRGRRLRGVPV